MASKLVNLFKTVAWSDYKTINFTPPPGKTVHVAQTAATIEPTLPNPTIVPVNGTKPTVYELVDNVVIKVVFDASQSWVADWVFKQSATYQKELLNHEQGHYNLVALLARDLFVDLMLLKGKKFTSSADGASAVKALIAPFAAKPKHISQQVSDIYDSTSETANGSIKSKQSAWDGYISKAFSTARTPPSSSPDGKAHKVRILDVLKSAGIKP